MLHFRADGRINVSITPQMQQADMLPYVANMILYSVFLNKICDPQPSTGERENRKFLHALVRKNTQVSRDQ